MRAWSRPNCLPHRRNGFRATAGFSLVELMIALTILSLIFMAIVPTYQRIQRKARTATIVNDFRVFATALETYAHASGSWPADVGPGIVPAGMSAEEIKFDDWARRTSIGGKYNWEKDALYGGKVYRAAIAITTTGDAPLILNTDQFHDIDQAIDDGDLSRGNFIFFGDSPVYIIEE